MARFQGWLGLRLLTRSVENNVLRRNFDCFFSSKCQNFLFCCLGASTRLELRQSFGGVGWRFISVLNLGLKRRAVFQILDLLLICFALVFIYLVILSLIIFGPLNGVLCCVVVWMALWGRSFVSFRISLQHQRRGGLSCALNHPVAVVSWIWPGTRLTCTSHLFVFPRFWVFMFLGQQQFGVRKTATARIESRVFPVLWRISWLSVLGLSSFWNLV